MAQYLVKHTDNYTFNIYLFTPVVSWQVTWSSGIHKQLHYTDVPGIWISQFRNEENFYMKVETQVHCSSSTCSEDFH